MNDTLAPLRLVLGVLVVSACSASEPEPAPTPQPMATSTVGTLVLQLELDADLGVPEVAYTISRVMQVQRKGTFVLESGSDSFRAVVGALPPRDDYTIQLSAAAPDPMTGIRRPCGGSGSFGVIAGEVTSLSIPIRCEVSSGSESESETENSETACPQIDAIRAVPAEATIGQTITLRSDVEHPERFDFLWTADNGAFTKVSTFQAGYVCTEVGIATIMVIVTNDNASCPEESAVVYVTCEDPPK